jgi:hypothetical protein
MSATAAAARYLLAGLGMLNQATFPKVPAPVRVSIFGEIHTKTKLRLSSEFCLFRETENIAKSRFELYYKTRKELEFCYENCET